MTEKEFVDRMIEVYGVRSYLDNEDDEDLWFECPECGEPILFIDYPLEGCMHQCPICEYSFDDDGVLED